MSNNPKTVGFVIACNLISVTGLNYIIYNQIKINKSLFAQIESLQKDQEEDRKRLLNIVKNSNLKREINNELLKQFEM
jgi:hypothetical protein